MEYESPLGCLEVINSKARALSGPTSTVIIKPLHEQGGGHFSQAEITSNSVALRNRMACVQGASTGEALQRCSKCPGGGCCWSVVFQVVILCDVHGRHLFFDWYEGMLDRSLYAQVVFIH